jgi:hypothetical protein
MIIRTFIIFCPVVPAQHLACTFLRIRFVSALGGSRIFSIPLK